MPVKKILKFGGSSVGSPSRIVSLIEIVSDPARYQEGEVLAVVVSAFQGVTDTLISLARSAVARESYIAGLRDIEKRHLEALHELLPATTRSGALASVKVLINELSDLLHGAELVGECSPRTLDHIMSFGERLSAFIVSAAFIAQGHAAEMLDARQVIVTNDLFGNARPDRAATDNAITSYFAEHSKLQIVTGFIGATKGSGQTTTLGRGGSDLSASIFGAALKVSEIEIWTDVDGMLTADPRKVPKAFPIPEVTFEEAMELCHFGAKVIYPPTMQPAITANIPIVIKNTFNPASQGTRIVKRAVDHPFAITGISSINAIALIRLEGSGLVGVTGTAMRLFRALATQHTNVILITQASSEHTICCAIDPAGITGARLAVEEEFGLEINAGLIAPLHVEENLAIVSVVGESMRSSPGMCGRVFSALGANGINVVAVAQGSSELNISAVISDRDEAKSLNALHDEFFLSHSKTINLWVVGTGLIGSTLLQQIASQREVLLSSLGIDLQLRGIANSRRMALSQDALTPLPISTELLDTQPAYDAAQFLKHAISNNLPNSIFVDCTASEEVPKLYPQLFEKSIAVVTPNKRGISGSLSLYSTLREAALKRRVPFLHETCVGAALPVLSTLNDLVRSGDTVRSIEAVLSGTLSFIFNSMSNGIPFSAAVKEAKELGYTEPDPRDDLSGLDVARKVLILARVAGIPLELEQIRINSILPEQAMNWSPDEFMEKIPTLDHHFEQQLNEAKNHRQRLFFGARIDCETGRAEIGMRAVALDHPFCALQGADNLVAFSTRRYSKQPLVVKGPGAGAEVTAAGVFADIIRIAR